MRVLLGRLIFRWDLMRDSRDSRRMEAGVTPDAFPDLRFLAPTRLLRKTMKLGPNREPETRSWIEKIPKGMNSVLWDVGANVGSFTILAAKAGIYVVAVEPMPENLLLLTRNISLNDVSNNCEVLPLALAGSSGTKTFWLSSGDYGSAAHAFGEPTRNGRPISPVRQFKLHGLTIDEAVTRLELKPPTHLKVDVDGIDDEIIFGADRTLRDVEGICCEVKFSDNRVRRLVEYLNERGLKMVDRTKRNAFFARN